MVHGRVQRNDSFMKISQEDDPKEDDFVFEAIKSRPENAALVKPIAEPSAMDLNPSGSPVTTANEDEHRLTPTSTQTNLAEKPTPSFRAPLNDTQDLFSDSQTSDTQSDQSNKKSGSQEEEYVASSLPSLNLKFDSALPDDICSDKEESDEDNNEPHPQTLFKGNSSPKGDPVKQFLDEEALEDDSDNDILQFDDEDECENADAEEVRDYIATDFKEKPVDHERCNELHQMWLQQQDEAGTENLLQKLKHGTDNQREPSLLMDDDNEREKDESDGSDDDDTTDLFPKPGARLSTKKLKQMIPHMFTDKDDGFVSSEDEETERKLSRQRLLQKLELERQPQLLSLASDETSREVFTRIKKLNTVPDPKKKAKASYLFDSLLNKDGNNSSSKSSFLRRSSSHPVAPSSHRSGPRTGKSFIFGRDDSNSRNSLSLSEDSSGLMSQKETNAKNPSAKFISSQAKRSNGQTENRSEGVSNSTSLFEILKRSSSLQKGHDAQVNMVDHQAVFAALKPVKKRVKIEGRP